MAFSQATITGVVITPAPKRPAVVVSWTSSSSDGTPFQVYRDGQLAWSGTERRAVLPWPGYRATYEVGTVAAGEERTDFASSLPAPPGTGSRAVLAWKGGRYQIPGTHDLVGFGVYGPGVGSGTFTQVDLKDNAAFTITAGTGSASTSSSQAWGGSYLSLYFGFPSAKGYWQFTGLTAGTYRVQVSHPTSGGGALDIRYVVRDGAAGSGTIRVDVTKDISIETVESTASDGVRTISFVALGDALCSSGTLTVEVDTSTQSDSDDIWADACRIGTLLNVDYATRVGYVPGRSGPAWADGFGRGRAGRGRAGYSEVAYGWTSSPHSTAGLKAYGIRPVDEAGNEGTAAEVGITITLPPGPPAVDATTLKRLAYAYDKPSAKATLSWSPPA